MMTETKEFISKGRLDALTDGVFAFAMTLLVVNLDLPKDFHPTPAVELISALVGLRRHVHCLHRHLFSARDLLACARANQGGALVTRLAQNNDTQRWLIRPVTPS
jgi:hypothetical protein